MPNFMNPKRTTESERTPRVPLVQKWFAWILCAGVILCGQSASAQGQANREYKIKVAYIYKIALYVNQGDNLGLTTGEELVIGILGPDPFGKYLDLIAQKRKIHHKQIVIKRFANWDEYQPCDLLFVSKNADPRSVEQAQSAAGTESVLMVGEVEGFELHGGVFNMYLDESGKVGIKLNIDAAKRSNFRVDARLLQVCDIGRDAAKPQE